MTSEKSSVMDSTEVRKVDFRSLIVSAGCLFGAALAGYTLYLDLNEQGVTGQGKPIGKVERRESKVRRKASNSFVWTNVQPKEDLYRKDSIQTGRGSAVSIRLQDGSVLDIAESSLVVMDSSVNLSLQFLKGSVVVHKADGDAKVSVGKDGKTQVEELSVRLVRPESLANYFVPGKTPRAVSFSWEARSKNGGESYSVQVSTDRRFNPQFTQTFTPSDFKAQNLRSNLMPGKYFWRVLNKGAPITEERQFRVSSVSPILPIFPGEGQKISGTGPDFNLQFRWVSPRVTGPQDADVSQGEHRIEISADNTFKTLTLAEPVNPTNGSAALKQITDGKHFWRIRSVYGDYVNYSAGKSFELRRLPVAPVVQALPHPAFVKPEPGTVFNLTEKKPPLEASWSEVDGAENYEVTIIKEATATTQRQQVAKSKTDNTLFSLKDLGVGDYTWSVRALDKQGKAGEELPYRKFRMTFGDQLAAPKVVSPEVQ